jgi:acetyl esterase/lipase
MAMMVTPRLEHPLPLTFVPDVRYGEADGKPLLLDVMAPQRRPGPPRPAVIWLHGFGWFAGTCRDNLEISMCTFLAAHGFFTVSVEYRLSDEAIFPAQIHDVKAAIRWLRANAATHGIDPAHIGVWGGSAGGHLAALAGLTGDLPELEGHSGSPGYSSRVQAVAVASAPADFLRPGGAMSNDADGPVARLCGGTVVERGELMRLASPITHVAPGAPPILIAHGTLDETVPFEQGEWLYQALVRAGCEAQLIPIAGAHHNWLTAPEGIPGREDTWRLGPLALPFFEKYLRPGVRQEQAHRGRRSSATSVGPEDSSGAAPTATGRRTTRPES